MQKIKWNKINKEKESRWLRLLQLNPFSRDFLHFLIFIKYSNEPKTKLEGGGNLIIFLLVTVRVLCCSCCPFFLLMLLYNFLFCFLFCGDFLSLILLQGLTGARGYPGFPVGGCAFIFVEFVVFSSCSFYFPNSIYYFWKPLTLSLYSLSSILFLLT